MVLATLVRSRSRRPAMVLPENPIFLFFPQMNVDFFRQKGVINAAASNGTGRCGISAES